MALRGHLRPASCCAPPPDTRSLATRVRLGAAAERLGRDLLRLGDGVRWPRRAPRASSRAWSGCRRTRRSTAGAARCRPRRRPPSPTACRASRRPRGGTSNTDSVPRLPTPDCTYSLPSGLIDEQPVEAGGAGDERAHGHADAAHLRSGALARSRLALLPAEQLGAAVERFLDERAGRVAALALRVGRPELRLALGRVEAADRHLIDAELARRLGDAPARSS